MVEDLIDDATSRLYTELSGQPPLVESEDESGVRHSLYRVTDGSSSPNGQGLYAVTSSEDDVVETVRFYGAPSDAEFTTPKYEYLDRCPDEFEDLIHEYYDLLESAERNSMGMAFALVFDDMRGSRDQFADELEDEGYEDIEREMRSPQSDAVAVDGRTIYVAQDATPRERTLEDIVESEYKSFGDSAITEDEYEAVDWEALGEATREAMFGWRRSKADGVVDDDWDGYAVLVDYDDWRETARDLALHTSLSDGQAVAVAVMEQDFSQTTVADILGKDKSTISQQLKTASDKFVKAKKTANRLECMESHALRQTIGAAEEREENRVAKAKYERSKSPEVGFYACPNCGLDTGSYTGSANNGEFESDDPPEFITGTYAPPRAQHPDHIPVKVTCPECGHEDWRDAFEDEWTDEHGKLPEPDNIPHPEPTASRLHQQALDAAKSKRRQRDNRRY